MYSGNFPLTSVTQLGGVPRLTANQDQQQHVASYPLTQQQLPIALQYSPAYSSGPSELSGQPSFYTSCFRLSHTYTQQPPVTSWVMHRQSHPLQNVMPYYSQGQYSPRSSVHQQVMPGSSFPLYAQGDFTRIHHGGRFGELPPAGDMSMRLHQTRIQRPAGVQTPAGVQYPIPPGILSHQQGHVVIQPQLQNIRVTEQSALQAFSSMFHHHQNPVIPQMFQTDQANAFSTALCPNPRLTQQQYHQSIAQQQQINPSSQLDFIGLSPEKYLEEIKVESNANSSEQQDSNNTFSHNILSQDLQLQEPSANSQQVQNIELCFASVVPQATSSDFIVKPIPVYPNSQATTKMTQSIVSTICVPSLSVSSSPVVKEKLLEPQATKNSGM